MKGMTRGIYRISAIITIERLTPPTHPHSRWTASIMMDEECDSSREMYWEAGNCSVSYDVAGGDLTRTEHFCETTELKFLWSLICLITDCTNWLVEGGKKASQ